MHKHEATNATVMLNGAVSQPLNSITAPRCICRINIAKTVLCVIPTKLRDCNCFGMWIQIWHVVQKTRPTWTRPSTGSQYNCMIQALNFPALIWRKKLKATGLCDTVISTPVSLEYALGDKTEWQQDGWDEHERGMMLTLAHASLPSCASPLLH